MKRKQKHDLDARVALELGLDVKEVRGITRAFFELMTDALIDFEEVTIAEFGRFRMVIEKPSRNPVFLSQMRQGTKKTTKKRMAPFRKVRVHFSRAEGFKRKVREKLGPSEKS